MMLSRTIVWGLTLSLVLIVFFTPLSMWILSKVEYREGLEVVADKLNLTNLELYRAPLHDYLIPGVENEYLATIIAGVIGVAIAVAVTTLILKLIAVKGGGRR